jgi:hypothetical protein
VLGLGGGAVAREPVEPGLFPAGKAESGQPAALAGIGPVILQRKVQALQLLRRERLRRIRLQVAFGDPSAIEVERSQDELTSGCKGGAVYREENAFAMQRKNEKGRPFGWSASPDRAP